jgi:uncharacterized membrane protein
MRKKIEKFPFFSSTDKNQTSFLGIMLYYSEFPCTLGWPYTVGTWLYCDYFIWCVSCTVVVVTSFVMCGCVCMCGCFGNMCTCIYCVLYFLYCLFYVSFRLCIFSLICCVCTSVRTTATEWQLNCSNNNNNNNTYNNNLQNERPVWRPRLSGYSSIHLYSSIIEPEMFVEFPWSFGGVICEKVFVQAWVFVKIE